MNHAPAGAPAGEVPRPGHDGPTTGRTYEPIGFAGGRREERPLSDSPLHVRLFGGLQAVRHDGTRVERAEWRTAKTMDLLLILALADGEPVPTRVLLDRLWPASPQHRARSSLRTAASQLRRTSRSGCVQRHPEGLRLVDAWVDVPEFFRYAAATHAAWRDGRAEDALETTRRAEELHVDDLRARDDSSEWVVRERELVAEARLDMLCEAAECALGLHRAAQARDHAATAVVLSSTSERAHRLLMRSYAELGDVQAAHAIFARYRARLSRQLGVDASPQTQELHAELVAGEVRQTRR